MTSYLKDPQAIYAQSFATVRREAQLDRFDPLMRAVAARVIHACGMTEIAEHLEASPCFGDVARDMLASGSPILCDCNMTAAGIIRRALPAQNDVIVTLDAPEVPSLAEKLGTTRSAAAVELWHGRIQGAVVAIGNAPTALFHLLEKLDCGWPMPAAIIGFPVGFVGAAESKEQLVAKPRGVEFLTLHGRRGGSAMASAALNALAGLAGGSPPGTNGGMRQ